MNRRIARKTVSGLALLALAVTQPVDAQRPVRARAAGNDVSAVRGELAAVLLQARRYAEAAREYRALLARSPNDFAARLGLARALAWGNQPRAAEPELRILRSQRPGHREVDELLLAVRESIEPRSAEAAAWLAERPGHLPYRRALARALVREGKAGAALPHYEALVQQDRSPLFAREAAHAHVAANQPARATQFLRGLLMRAPGDTALRHALATTLAGARQYEAALATYDTLIVWFPEPVLLLERAQVQLARRDLAAAEADALTSLNARPNVGAYLLLGDLRRWRGDHADARIVYGYARTLRPDDAAVSAAAAQLRRDERPIIAFVVHEDYVDGWRFESTAAGDNEGAIYASLGAQRHIPLVHGFVGSANVALRRMAAEPMAGGEIGITGFAFGLGLMRDVAHGRLLGRFSGRAGLVQHDAGATFAGAFAATGWVGPWGLSLEHARGPAYATLLTAGSIRPEGFGAKPLTETTSGIAIGGPLRSVDVALRVQRTAFSDENRRSTAQALARFPLNANVYALLSAAGIWFTERSPLYWDPMSYIAGAAGVEFAQRRQRGLSFATRVLAGPARTMEEVVTELQTMDVTGVALQLNAGGDLSFRTETRELGAAVTYGSGRTGAYRRFEANFFMRLSR